MSEPKRIQRRRTKGWRMPDGAVYVGRPTKWGNPWTVVPVRDANFPFSDAADVVTDDGTTIGRFERYSRGPRSGAPYWAVQGFNRDFAAGLAEEARAELAGRDLACWCPLDQPCHADVLLELANGTPA